MSRKNKNKKDILEIKYKINDDLHSMTPLLNANEDKKSFATNNDPKTSCKAGQTRCVNNKKQYSSQAVSSTPGYAAKQDTDEYWIKFFPGNVSLREYFLSTGKIVWTWRPED